MTGRRLAHPHTARTASVLTNLLAHSTPEITKWLAHKDRRRWRLQPTTPTSSSWLNLSERWFKDLTDKRLRRSVFTSVADLTPKTSSTKSDAARKPSTRSIHRP